MSGSASEGCAFKTLGESEILLGSILFNLSISSALTSISTISIASISIAISRLIDLFLFIISLSKLIFFLNLL